MFLILQIDRKFNSIGYSFLQRVHLYRTSYNILKKKKEDIYKNFMVRNKDKVLK